MNRKDKIWAIVIVVITFWILLQAYILYRVPKEVPRINDNIPMPDPNKTPVVFNFYTEEWEYQEDIDARSLRAKEYYKQKSEEDEFKELLNRKIDGYKENTYWGEDWEFNDIEETDDEEELID